MSDLMDARTTDRARGAGPAERRAGSDRYLTFALGGEVYALPILEITEIMEYRTLTVVPMMPSFIRGVINLRGRVVPVVDMSVRFGGGRTETGRRTSIIIVETHGDGDGVSRQMGVMVDAVNKVVQLTSDDIEPPPAFGSGIRSDFIGGMAKYNGDFVIVLDVSRVLSLDEMSLVDQASRTGASLQDASAAPAGRATTAAVGDAGGRSASPAHHDGAPAGVDG